LTNLLKFILPVKAFFAGRMKTPVRLGLHHCKHALARNPASVNTANRKSTPENLLLALKCATFIDTR
jgi:hypothetical protein